MYNIFNFTFANNVKRYIFTKSGAKLQQKSHIRKFFCIYFIKITGYIQSIYKVVWDTILVRCASDMPLIRLLCLSLMVFMGNQSTRFITLLFPSFIAFPRRRYNKKSKYANKNKEYFNKNLLKFAYFKNFL